MILFSTAANAFRLRQEYKEFIELLKKAVAERNVIVRILADTDDPIKNMIENLRRTRRRKKRTNY